jgi:hypothetical protein
MTLSGILRLLAKIPIYYFCANITPFAIELGWQRRSSAATAVSLSTHRSREGRLPGRRAALEQRALRREAIAHHVEEGAHPCSALEIGMIGIVGLKLQAG